MPTPNLAYNDAKYRFMTGQINWTSGALAVWGLLLVGNTSPTAALDPDLSTLEDLLGLTGVTEANGTGYSRVALPGRSVVKDTTLNRAVLTADPLQWDALDVGVVQAVILYEKGSTDALSNLLWAVVNGFPKATNGAPFNVLFPNGVAYL